MAWQVKVAYVADIPLGSMKAFSVDGKSVLLANVGGKFYGIGAICTHREWDKRGYPPRRGGCMRRTRI
jgi:nitrite reductase/ring-hydroxylating ferredoxin subunit